MSSKSTAFDTTLNGEIVFLDRHHPSCGSTSYIRGFRMESSGDNIRYVYECINLKQSVCTSSVKNSNDADHGTGKLINIDRFPIDCGNSSYLSGFMLKRTTEPMAHYRMECCEATPSLSSAVDCYTGSTSYNDRRSDDLNLLDRHQVWCNTGYALSSFKYLNNGDYTQLKMEYRCCKLY